MKCKITPLLDPLQKLLGVGEEATQRLVAAFETELPADYCEFLRLTNGAYGFLGPNYLHLYSVEDVLACVNAAESWPGMVIIGSTGDSTAYFAIDASSKGVEEMTYVAFDPYGIGGTFIFREKTLLTFLQRMATRHILDESGGT